LELRRGENGKRGCWRKIIEKRVYGYCTSDAEEGRELGEMKGEE
jgi:hypothetical protein